MTTEELEEKTERLIDWIDDNIEGLSVSQAERLREIIREIWWS
jgi:hypothetical protein